MNSSNLYLGEMIPKSSSGLQPHHNLTIAKQFVTAKIAALGNMKLFRIFVGKYFHQNSFNKNQPVKKWLPNPLSSHFD
jgi:hypothetical protein